MHPDGHHMVFHANFGSGRALYNAAVSIGGNQVVHDLFVVKRNHHTNISVVRNFGVDEAWSGHRSLREALGQMARLHSILSESTAYRYNVSMYAFTPIIPLARLGVPFLLQGVALQAGV